MNAARGLGRGAGFKFNNAENVRDAYDHFFAGVPSHTQLLADAGIEEAELAALRGHRTAVDGVLLGAGHREDTRGAADDQIARLSLALDSGFAWYRSRIRMALGDDEAALARALRPLPRAQDRRSKATAPAMQPPPAGGAPKP